MVKMACTKLSYIITLIMCCVSQSWATDVISYDDKPAITARHHACHRDPNLGNQLPMDIKPTHYKIKLIPFIEDDNFTTDGEVWITVECVEPTDVIILNIAEIEICFDTIQVTQLTPSSSNIEESRKSESKNDEIGQPEDKEIKVNDYHYTTQTQTYSITLDEKLIKGRLYTLYMKYHGRINDQLQGLYRSSYLDPESGKKHYLVSTDFAPVFARKVFPCFDEPKLKAHFQLSLARPGNMKSLSNMIIRSTEPMTEIPDWEWDHYNETDRMSTYVMAFVIFDQQALEPSLNLLTNKSDFRFTVWSPEAVQSQTQYAASVASRILHYFENYLNIAYPLPKLDMVALPDLRLAGLGNFGLIFVRESTLLYDSNVSSEALKERLAQVVSQMVVNQWFGGLITPLWWNDLWLSAGFSTYFRYEGVNYVEPLWRQKDRFIKDHLQPALKFDSLKSSHPVSVRVELPSQIREIQARVSFSKAASLIRMMISFLSEDTFKKGLFKYMEHHLYGNVCQDDLWGSLTSKARADGSLPSDLNVKEIMDTWTLQPGYPVITVLRNYDTGSANITQERFLQCIKKSNKENNNTWWVPLTYTTQAAQDFNTTKPHLWLKNEAFLVVDQLTDRDSWVLFNIQQSGFYRVNYDENNWKLLTASFKDLPDVTRAQLLDDALNLAFSGQLAYQIALDLTSKLANDIDFLPWSSALMELKRMDALLALTPTYGNFTQVMLELVQDVYSSVQFEPQQTDTHMDILKRTKILYWACKLSYKPCVASAVTKYQKCMESDATESKNQTSSLLDADQRKIVYCTAIRHGGVAEWEFAWKKYQASNSEYEREQLLNVLGCTREPWLLNRYLSYIISNTSEIRKQDGFRVFTAVARNTIGHHLALRFLLDNWKFIKNYYGSSSYSVSRMISAVAYYMNTSSQLSQLKKLQESTSSQMNTTKGFEQSIELVQGNIKWMAQSYSEVDMWLASYPKTLQL